MSFATMRYYPVGARNHPVSGLKPLQRRQRGKITWSHTGHFCNSFLFFSRLDFCWTKHCCCPTLVGYICLSRNAKLSFVHARQVQCSYDIFEMATSCFLFVDFFKIYGLFGKNIKLWCFFFAKISYD